MPLAAGAVRATLSEVASLMGDVSLMAHNLTRNAHNLMRDGVARARLSTWKVGCARNFNLSSSRDQVRGSEVQEGCPGGWFRRALQE